MLMVLRNRNPEWNWLRFLLILYVLLLAYVVAYIFNPNIWEAEASGFLSSSLACRNREF